MLNILDLVEALQGWTYRTWRKCCKGPCHFRLHGQENTLSNCDTQLWLIRSRSAFHSDGFRPTVQHQNRRWRISQIIKSIKDSGVGISTQIMVSQHINYTVFCLVGWKFEELDINLPSPILLPLKRVGQCCGNRYLRSSLRHRALGSQMQM